jgi:hypothetical protein
MLREPTPALRATPPKEGIGNSRRDRQIPSFGGVARSAGVGSIITNQTKPNKRHRATTAKSPSLPLTIQSLSHTSFKIGMIGAHYYFTIMK